MNDDMEKKMDEMEQALLDSAVRYQSEVGEFVLSQRSPLVKSNLNE